MFDIFDDIVASCDEQMAEGVSAEQLDAEMFEHFFCRTIECETFDGRKISGDAVAFRKTKKPEGFSLSISEKPSRH